MSDFLGLWKLSWPVCRLIFLSWKHRGSLIQNEGLKTEKITKNHYSRLRPYIFSIAHITVVRMTAEENIFCSTTSVKKKKVKHMSILETCQTNYREVVAHFLEMCEVFSCIKNMKGANWTHNHTHQWFVLLGILPFKCQCIRTKRSLILICSAEQKLSCTNLEWIGLICNLFYF